MDKQNVLYPHNGILLSHKRKWSRDTSYNTDESQKCYAKWCKSMKLEHSLTPYTHMLLLLSHFSHVQLCATPEMAAHQAPPSPGFSRQEHWSGLPFPSPMHASKKWKWSRSVMSDPQWPHGLQPTRLLRPWDFPGKSTGVGCHCLLQKPYLEPFNCSINIY